MEKIDEIVKESGLQLSEGEAIKISYAPYFDELALAHEQMKKINFENPTDIDEDIARKIRLSIVKIRTGSEKVKNERKKVHQLKANLEQNAWNLIKSTCLLDEENLAQVEKRRELERQAEIKALQEDRAKTLEAYDIDPIPENLGEMDENMWKAYSKGIKTNYEEKIAAEKAAEAARIKEEELKKVRDARRIEIAPYFSLLENADLDNILNMEKKEYAKVLESGKVAKDKYDKEQAEIRKENERLRKENEAQKAKEEAERKERERIQAEKDAKAEAERKKQLKIQAEKDALIAKEKAEAEAKAKRLEKELADSKEAERIAKQTILQVQSKAKIDTTDKPDSSAKVVVNSNNDKGKWLAVKEHFNAIKEFQFDGEFDKKVHTKIVEASDKIIAYIDKHIKDDEKILLLDIETTGFNHKTDVVLEIGIAELNLKTGEVKKLYDQVLREPHLDETTLKDAWIIENSTLTVEEIIFAPFLEDEREKIQSIINDYPLGITAFNNVFDFGFMEDRGFDLGKKLPCPMKLSTDICKLPNKNGYSGYKWPSAQEAYDILVGKKGYVEQHRGYDDAAHEAEIVKVLYDKGIFKLS